ncbi:hypothetical protein NliqN6_4724 [Naganishia liquefaciens]|uniref:Protein yippee-like n=1 Tax=Naganishia liquefaciens TaxID=104408 RepID=A0A8H3TWB8_9TREE|nr:hypothetical protein NliqN6_4724 [Naganishia liquefaciens]
MPQRHRVYLAGGKVYGCRKCKTHFAVNEHIGSKAFNGQHGKAYLFNLVVNVKYGEPHERQMTTGRHVVRDMYCGKCGVCVGWKYDRAYDLEQRYKEGRWILEINQCTSVE